MSKESAEPPEQLPVTLPGAVDIICNLGAIRKLEPFMRAEQTLSTAAALLEVTPSTLAYWIPRFIRNGLLVAVRSEARAGMASTWYRATARSWFVPMSALGGEARSRFVDDARNRAWERYLQAVRRAEETMTSAGLTFVPHPERGIAISYSPPAQEVLGFFELYASVELTDDELADVQRRLEELGTILENTVKRPGTTRYLVNLGIVRDHAPAKRPRRRITG